MCLSNVEFSHPGHEAPLICTLQSDPSCPLSVRVRVTPLAVIQAHHSRNWSITLLNKVTHICLESPLRRRINNDILFCVWQTYDWFISTTILLLPAYSFHVNQLYLKKIQNAIP